MQKPLSSNIAGYLKAHLQKKRWKQVVTVLACLVVFGTTYALILPAITMTGETFCGKQAHTHSVEAGCYTQGEPHVHTEDCYKEASVLTCGLAETEGHTHGDSCYDEDRNLICGQEEADAHTHTEDCYTTQKTLVCGKEEGAAESVLTCKLEEHAHTLACYSNPDADTEAPALPALSGNAAADAAAIAKAQLGYTESSKKYAVAPDGETTYGYTCYGAAYGNAYADDWSALFARYCLDKAGVSEAFPRTNTCAGWLAALAAQELYRDAAGYAPKPGDVAFYDLDGDGAAEHTGIVLDAETAAVGDVNGKVEKEALTAAAGFGALPASGPKKAAAAAPSKPTFELNFSGKSHGADGKWLFYTGETFKANVSLSDNAQDCEQTTEDDGMVARIYMRFTKTVPPTGNTSFSGLPSVINSGTITANGGRKYTNTVTHIAGADPNHYTYCYDIQRPLNGDTLNIDLPCAYPSPNSAGGAVEIWGMILTKEEKEALDGGSTPRIQEPAEGEAVTAHWETRRDDFSLSKTNATSSRLPYVSFDDDGDPTITQLWYHVDVKRDTTETLEGIGKDFLVSVDYVDTLTLPENTYTKLFRAEPGRNVSDQFGGHSFFQKDGNGSLDDFLSDYLREYDATKGKGYIPIPTGNHDMPRISVQRTKRELKVVYAFLMTMPGVPFVYYGDEIGLPYRADLPSKEGGFNRTGARTPMQWTDGKNAGFSEADADKLYLPMDEHGVNVAGQLADENSLLHTMQKLIALRKSSPALCADGEIEFVNRRHNGYPLVYRRWLGSEEYLVCINPLDVPEAYSVGEGWQTALANQNVRIDNAQLTLEPFGYVILKMARSPA